MTDPRDDEVWCNIRDNYSDELQDLIIDTVEGCRRAGMERGEVATLVLVPLLCESVMAAGAARLDYDRFMTLCGGVYRSLQEKCDRIKSPNKMH